MTLADPREALADQSDFIGYLLGLAGFTRVIHTLATDGDRRSGPHGESDDFVHVLLGLASMGAAVDRLANPTTAQQNSIEEALPPVAPTIRWLR